MSSQVNNAAFYILDLFFFVDSCLEQGLLLAAQLCFEAGIQAGLLGDSAARGWMAKDSQKRFSPCCQTGSSASKRNKIHAGKSRFLLTSLKC